eukprot:3895829-Amphidinium_carterae.4
MEHPNEQAERHENKHLPSVLSPCRIHMDLVVELQHTYGSDSPAATTSALVFGASTLQVSPVSSLQKLTCGHSELTARH